MYLWPLLDRLWIMFRIFFAQTTNTNIEKDLLHSEVEVKGQSSDDQSKMFQMFLFQQIPTAQCCQMSHPLRVSGLLK